MPVNLDDPNPAGSGGIIGASLAINYDPAVLTFDSVQAGAAYPVAGGWALASTDNQPSGLLGISLVNQGGTPNTSTVGGNLALITFTVNANAPVGQSLINIVPSNTPGSLTVNTGLTAKNAGYSMPAQRPPPTRRTTLGWMAPLPLPGPPLTSPWRRRAAPRVRASFRYTVTALDQFGETVTTYGGTVAFTSSDTGAVFVPTSGMLTSGVGVFTVTLKTAGNQTLTATDTTNSSVQGSATVTVTAATHFVVSSRRHVSGDAVCPLGDSRGPIQRRCQRLLRHGAFQQ